MKTRFRFPHSVTRGVTKRTDRDSSDALPGTHFLADIAQRNVSEQAKQVSDQERKSLFPGLISNNPSPSSANLLREQRLAGQGFSCGETCIYECAADDCGGMLMCTFVHYRYRLSVCIAHRKKSGYIDREDQ